MLFIFSTPELIRHLWQLRTIVFLHQCLICSVPLPGTNTLSLWSGASGTNKFSFMAQYVCVNIVKLFSSSLCYGQISQSVYSMDVISVQSQGTIIKLFTAVIYKGSWQARVFVLQWKGINRKQSTKWRHLSRLKASAFFSLQKNFSCYKTQQLIVGTGTAIWWVIEPH